MKKLFYFIIILIFGACSVTTEEDTKATATSSTAIPDYETTTLSGKVAGTSWTFQTGRVTVPSSSSGSYWVYMTNDNLSNACSSTYTGTSSNPTVFYARSEAPTVGETELGWGTDKGTATAYDGSTNYILSTGKISIVTATTTEVTGKMYAKYDSDNEINGTFTLSRCCLSDGTYSLCE